MCLPQELIDLPVVGDRGEGGHSQRRMAFPCWGRKEMVG